MAFFLSYRKKLIVKLNYPLMTMDEILIDKERLLRFLREMVSLDSVNPPGTTTEVAKYLVERAQEHELSIDQIEYEQGKWAVRLSLYTERKAHELKKEFVISGHMDVVPYGNLSLWSRKPEGELAEDHFYGRGASDMKSGLAIALETLIRLKEEDVNLPFNVSIIATSDEEVGLTGADYIEANTNWMDRCRYLVITEPTDLQVACAHKGVLWIKMKVHGEAAHGSQPERGKNAVIAASMAVPKIYSCIPSQETDDLLGKVSINLGTFHGGKSPNVVPEYCELFFDIRTIPGIDTADLVKKMEQSVEKITEETECVFEFEKVNESDSVKSAPSMKSGQLLLDEIKAITGQESLTSMTYGTDGAMLMRNVHPDTEFVLFGPGDIATMHKPDEKVKLSYLYASAQALLNTVKKIEN